MTAVESPDRTGAAPLETARPTRISPLRHGMVLAGRNLTKVRTSPQLLLFTALQPIIMLLLFLLLLGGAVEGDRSEYLTFLLPGILAQNAAFMSALIAIAINTDIEKGVFDRFRSLPVARSAPLVGHIVGDMPRHLAGTLIILGLGVALGFRITTDPLSAVLAIALVLVVSFALSWGAVTIGLVADKPESVNMLAMLLIFPLAFGSNTLVPTDTLPGWLQVWVKINPMTHLTDALRSLLTGTPDHAGREVGWTLLSALALLVIFVPLAVRSYRRRL